MKRSMSRRSFLLGSTAVALSACTPQARLSIGPQISAANGIVETPDGNPRTVNLLYFTDRLPDGNGFGADRSRQLIYGEGTVALGKTGTDLPDLISNASTGRPALQVSEVTKLGEIPATPLPFRVVDGKPVNLPGPNNAYNAAQADMRKTIAEHVAASRSKEVMVLVPGFNMPFDDGLYALTSLWYHTQRDIVPMIYSWPSGSDGLLGYLTDRESGEFTIYHLKEYLRVLASVPGLRRIHMVAHSRGAAVATSALREMIIEDRAAGRDPIETMKIENLILAAPDLSFDVVGQRLVTERFGLAFGRVTVYINRSDTALGVAQRLMAGVRFGRLQPEDVPENERVIFGNLKKINFIRVARAGSRFGHNYYVDNPRVLSDIIQLIRTRADPGTIDRPLEPINGNFWTLPDPYLNSTDS